MSRNSIRRLLLLITGLAVAGAAIFLMIRPITKPAESHQPVILDVFPSFAYRDQPEVTQPSSTVVFQGIQLDSFLIFGQGSSPLGLMAKECDSYYPERPTVDEQGMTRGYLRIKVAKEHKICIREGSAASVSGLRIVVGQMNVREIRLPEPKDGKRGENRLSLNEIEVSAAGSDDAAQVEGRVVPAMFGVGLTLIVGGIRALRGRARRSHGA